MSRACDNGQVRFGAIAGLDDYLGNSCANTPLKQRGHKRTSSHGGVTPDRRGEVLAERPCGAYRNVTRRFFDRCIAERLCSNMRSPPA